MVNAYSHSKTICAASFDAPSLAVRLGKNVERLRKSEHIIKTRFSAMLGIGRPQLNKIEKGTADIRLSLVEELASALDTTPEYLLFSKDDVLRNPPVSPQSQNWPLV